MTESSVPSARATLLNLAWGYRVTQALRAVAKLGVADVLKDGPLDAGEIARRVGAHPRSLFRVMRALAPLGVFTQDASDRFGLTPMGELLRTDHPETVRHTLIFAGEEVYRVAAELVQAVRTGETQFERVYGMHRFEHLGANPEVSATFNAAMAEGVRSSRSPFDAYDFAGRRVVMDVGGGNGELLASILAKNPHLRGILFDMPQGVAEAGPLLRKRGVADRCQVVPGSMFEAVPSGADAYVLSRVLHDWPDGKAASVLANVRKAVPPGGVLLIREFVIPPGDAPSPGKMRDLTMFLVLDGAERTEAEWHALLSSTSFELTRVIAGGGSEDLIEAKPA